MDGYVYVPGHDRRGPDGKWAWVAPYPATPPYFFPPQPIPTHVVLPPGYSDRD
jgi:hypothetical protein